MISNIEARAKLAKKCPFCGSRKIKTDNPEFIMEKEIRVVEIRCEVCGARVEAHTKEPDFMMGYRDALKRWNRRTA